MLPLQRFERWIESDDEGKGVSTVVLGLMIRVLEGSVNAKATLPYSTKSAGKFSLDAELL